MRSYFFIRHAQPINDAGSFHLSALDADMRGEQDHPLSAEGRSQAEQLVPVMREIGIERVVSSSMQRARDTAQILAAGAQLPFEDQWDELDEFNPGGLSSSRIATLRRWTQRTLPLFPAGARDALLTRVLTLYYLWRWKRQATHGADEPDAMRRRVVRVLQRLWQLPDTHIAIVGHGFWILYMCLMVLDIRPTDVLRNLRWIENCSVTRVDAVGPGDCRMAYFSRVMA